MSDGITEGWKEVPPEKEVQMELRRVKGLYFELGEAIKNLENSLYRTEIIKDITPKE